MIKKIIFGSMAGILGILVKNGLARGEKLHVVGPIFRVGKSDFLKLLFPIRVEKRVFWENSAQKRCFSDACNSCHLNFQVTAIAG